MSAGREDTETVGEVIAVGPRIPMLAPGTLIAGRFEIVRPLGSGGSSIVYEALDTTLLTRVALKILRVDRTTPSALKRLRREASIAREANDPRLVRVWDIGDAPEGAFISMELVEGESLRAVVERGPLPVGDAIRIGTEVVSALEKLHDLGVIHRDLKPSNVLLTPERGVKLVDFGLARHWEGDESRATQGDALVGTVEYLSPEQALGRTLDPRTDLYSFGVLLFEMLTGAVPFRSESTLGAVLAHVRERAPDVRKLRPDVPPWLARVIARLLEKRPGDRYASAAEVLRDLRLSRAGLRIPRRAWIAVALALAIAFAVAGAWHLSRPKFASFGRGPDGITAIDANGRELWRVAGASTAAALLRRDGRPVAVAVTRDAKTVMLLDPDTGRTRREIAVPDASYAFPEYPWDYTANLAAVDLNHDGREELIASLFHRYYPFYAVRIDPFAGDARIIFVASGSHALVGSADLDGEAGDELLFAGINNRMGWYGSIVALRTTGAPDDSYASVPASTPDNDAANLNAREVLWYELLPQGWFGRSNAAIDPARRTIQLRLVDGRVIEMDFHGFKNGTVSALSIEARLDARRRAFDLERAARRSLALGDIDEGLRTNRAARVLAESAGSPILVEWLDRSHASALVKSGRIGEAESEFERLADRSDARGDVCWDAARALHLRGDLRRALRWYERGLASSGRAGRLKSDFIEAGLVAYAATGDFAAARSFIDRSIEAHSSYGDLRAMYEALIQWQETGRAIVPPRPGRRSGDFQRAIYFELRNAANAKQADLLKELDDTGPFSELRPLNLSLRAELARRGGDPARAAELARSALDEALARSNDDPVIAYFLPLIKERYQLAAASRP